MSGCLRAATAASAAALSGGRFSLRFSSAGVCHRRSASTHPLAQRQSDSADVVIIGGGIVGVSAAYHLAKAGVKEVVLLEKSELTAGSTWHAAGLITYFHPGINVRRLNHYSLQLYQQLEQDTGQQVGLHKPGSLRLITSNLRMDEAKYQMARSHWCQAEQHLIEPEACLQLCPLLDPSRLLGGVYNPNDGHVDPYSVTMALASAARSSGAQLYQNCRVRATAQQPDGTWTVGTDHGDIRATHVINAAGFHARDVGKLAGIDLPIIPVHHQYVITGPVPQVKSLQREFPVLRDLDGSYYLRQEKHGLLVGPYESPDSMQLCKDWYDNGVPDEFGRELFEPDLQRIMPHLEHAMQTVPALQEAQIQSVIAGPITYNAENAGLVGPVSGLHNYWLLAGFGYGIVHGGGVGKFVADWIVDGEPPFDLIELDANRYGWWADRTFLFARAAETYGMNNAVGYPKEERWAGRPTRRAGPLYATLEAAGAQFGFHNGWEQPHWYGATEEERRYSPSFRRTNWFGAVRRECEAVLQRVGVCDLSSFAKFRISGPAAPEFLDRVGANFVPRVGRTCLTHLLTPRGRVFAELTLTRTEPQQFLALSGSGSEHHDLCWLRAAARRFGLGDAVSVENVTDDFAGVGVAGPLARDLLQPLTDADLSPTSFGFMSATPATVAGVSCLLLRLSYTGELGWELYCPPAHAVQLYTAVRQAAERLGGSAFGAYALNSLRMEKGFAMWGAEMNCDTNPAEAGLQAFVRVAKKADFVGKPAVAELFAAGNCQRRLRLLRVDCDDVDPEGNETVWMDAEVVGNTTSGSYSSSLQCGLAFAYLPESLGAGSEVEIELLGSRRQATVLPRPPLLPEPARSRQSSSSSSS